MAVQHDHLPTPVGRRIVVGVDGSAASLAGVEFIAALQLSARDSIVVATIVEPPYLVGLGLGRASDRLFDELSAAAHERGRTIAERAAERLIGLPCDVRTEVLMGHPVESLRRLATGRRADLLVLGPHGRGQLGSLILGSVSQSLLGDMPTSMLIARPPTHRLTNVLLAIDGSPQSLAAAEMLSSLPLPMGAVVSVCISMTPWTDEYADLPHADFLDLFRAEREHSESIADRAIGLLGSVGSRATRTIRQGDPKREILGAASDLGADLIVLGSRGLGGFKGLLLGSVSRGVAKAAPCSVLVVAPPHRGTRKARPSGSPPSRSRHGEEGPR